MRRFIALMLFSGQVIAADLTINWQNPTQDVTGAPLPTSGSSALKDTRVEVGTCNADNTFRTKTAELLVNQPTTTAVFTGLATNTKYCFRAFARNNALEVSSSSNIIAKWVPTAAPKPPVLSATVNIAWFMAPNRRLTPIADVAIGSPCNSQSITVAGVQYNSINQEYVTQWNNRPVGTYYTICGVS
jgi:hypothetical protein